MPCVSGKCFFRPRSASSGSDVLPPRSWAPVPRGAWRSALSTSASDAMPLSSASATEDLLAVVTGRLPAGEHEAQRRHVHRALGTRTGRGAEAPVGATRVERATAGDAGQVRRLPGDRLQSPALGLDLRDRV